MNTQEHSPWKLLVAAGGFVLLVLAFGEALVYFSLHGWEKRGQFGDMFGVGNTVFSAFAFAGVIIAIYLQNKELGYQRKELELTRFELSGQREQLQRRNEITYMPLIHLVVAREGGGLFAHNIGFGPAFGVQIEPIVIADGEDGEIEVKEIGLLEKDASIRLVSRARIHTSEGEARLEWRIFQQSSLTPAVGRTINISFRDMGGTKYVSRCNIESEDRLTVRIVFREMKKCDE